MEIQRTQTEAMNTPAESFDLKPQSKDLNIEFRRRGSFGNWFLYLTFCCLLLRICIIFWGGEGREYHCFLLDLLVLWELGHMGVE